MDQLWPTLVKKGATIGANARTICVTTIGRYAFIGAGAVVTRDIPDHVLGGCPRIRFHVISTEGKNLKLTYFQYNKISGGGPV